MRYRLIEGGKTLQADITIEDPAIFIQPLQVIHRWRRVQGPMTESSCPEGNFNYFNQDVEPLPTAERPDFRGPETVRWAKAKRCPPQRRDRLMSAA